MLEYEPTLDRAFIYPSALTVVYLFNGRARYLGAYSDVYEGVGSLGVVCAIAIYLAQGDNGDFKPISYNARSYNRVCNMCTSAYSATLLSSKIGIVSMRRNDQDNETMLRA